MPSLKLHCSQKVSRRVDFLIGSFGEVSAVQPELSRSAGPGQFYFRPRGLDWLICQSRWIVGSCTDVHNALRIGFCGFACSRNGRSCCEVTQQFGQADPGWLDAALVVFGPTIDAPRLSDAADVPTELCLLGVVQPQQDAILRCDGLAFFAPACLLRPAALCQEPGRIDLSQPGLAAPKSR